MNRSTATLVLYLSAVFLSGSAVGALSYRYYAGKDTVAAKTRRPRLSPEEFRQAFLNEMKTRVKIDDSQAAQIDTIMVETMRKFSDLRTKIRPQEKALYDEQVERISAVLNPQQQAEYAKMREERERRRKEEADRRAKERGR